jgi:hypothetical protein
VGLRLVPLVLCGQRGDASQTGVSLVEVLLLYASGRPAIIDLATGVGRLDGGDRGDEETSVVETLVGDHEGCHCEKNVEKRMTVGNGRSVRTVGRLALAGDSGQVWWRWSVLKEGEGVRVLHRFCTSLSR